MSSDNCEPSDGDFSNEGEASPSASSGTSSNQSVVITPEEEALKDLRADVLIQMSVDKKELARQRRYLFIGAGTFASIFLLSLLVLAFLYISQGREIQVSEIGNWQALLAVDAVFVLLAFIPLSIFWSLTKIIHNQQSGTDTPKTDGEKLAESLTSTLSSAKELITTVISITKPK